MRELDGAFTFASTDWSNWERFTGERAEGGVKGFMSERGTHSEPEFGHMWYGEPTLGGIPKSELRKMGEEAVKEWLDSGKEIKRCPTGMRTLPAI